MGTTSLRLALTTLAAIALSSACQGSTLDSLQRPALFVAPAQVIPGASLTLEYMAILVDQRPECLALGSTARGTINGEPAPKWSPGENRKQLHLNGSWSMACDFPSFHIPLEVAAADEVTVAFEDDTGRISATFLNLGRAPSLTVTPPADGHIRPGSTITLTYAPATDDLSNSQWVLEGPTENAIDLSRRQGASVQYTIPANHPTGPATISDVGARTPGVAACEGAEACVASILMGPGTEQPEFKPASASFTIEP